MQSLVKILKQETRISSFRGSSKGSQITADQGGRAETGGKHRSRKHRAWKRNQAAPAGTGEMGPAPQHHPVLETLPQEVLANTEMNVRASRQRCCNTIYAPAGEERCTLFSVHKHQPGERPMLFRDPQSLPYPI